MENTDTHKCTARLARSASISGIVTTTLLLLIPVANLLIGATVLAQLIATAIAQSRFIRLLGALALSVLAGFLISVGITKMLDAREILISAITLYCFVVGPAAAGLAGALVVFWPARSEDNSSDY